MFVYVDVGVFFEQLVVGYVECLQSDPVVVDVLVVEFTCGGALFVDGVLVGDCVGTRFLEGACFVYSIVAFGVVVV